MNNGKINLTTMYNATKEAEAEAIHEKVVNLVRNSLIPRLITAATAGRPDCMVAFEAPACLVKPVLEDMITCKKVSFISPNVLLVKF